MEENKVAYEQLKQKIDYHMDLYHNQNTNEISDYEYDQMMQELKAMEKEHPEWVTKDSPTQKIGGTAKREAGVTIVHHVPMLSIQDLFSKEEVVVDCGAFTGDTFKSYLYHVGEFKKYFAFEPDKEVFNVLLKNTLFY